jgi:DNA mismatch repair protein MutL
VPQGEFTTPRVRRLPDGLVDRIAAGEVVERPASVAKELLENALDAGASRIRLEARGGGADFLAVTDDGCGMTPEDADLALERHATSKLQSDEDLARIASYGFRGEALPAIASVSTLRLRTRPHDADEAYEIRVQAGIRVEARAAGGPPGTRIEVADLFEAVPARRKFLKTPQTEWSHIADVVTRAALSRPDVHFDVVRDDKPLWSWPAANDPLDRVAAVLGEREADKLLRVDWEEGRVRLWGFVSRPDRHRANLSGIQLFVNQRAVRDRLLQHALVEVYRDVLTCCPGVASRARCSSSMSRSRPWT